MEVRILSSADFGPATVDDAGYLSAESSVDDDELQAEIIDSDEDLAAGLYFSLPDICLMDFEYQLTEPLCPSMSSDQDSHSRYDSLNPPVSGLLLIEKHTLERPKIEYVSLSETDFNTAPDIAFLNSKNLQIFQSGNGLFLCFSPLSQLYSICCLATQQMEDLPGSPYMAGQFALSLAFDPYFSPYYKVICVQKLDEKKPLYQIAIYSSETHLWSLSGKPFGAQGDIDFNDAVFCNGAIHWMRRTSKGQYFDVDKELLREMPKPPLKEAYPLASCEYFGGSLGRLYYAVATPELSDLELFVMKEDYSGWLLRTIIDLSALAVDFPIMARRSNHKHPFFPSYECDVLSVVQAQDSEELQVLLSIPGEVIAYNDVRKSAKSLCHLSVADRAVWYRVFAAYQCFDL